MTSFDALPPIEEPSGLARPIVGGDGLRHRLTLQHSGGNPSGREERPGRVEPAKPLRQAPSEREARHHGSMACRARALSLVLLAGALFGASPAIGRVSAGIGLPPLGLVFWSNVLAATVCLTWTVVRSGPPRFSRADIRVILVWAIVLGCLYQTLTIVVAAHVEASVIALVNSSRGFLVFLLAAALMLEAASLRRFLGLGLGFVSVAGLLATDASLQDAAPLWLAACFALPALLAIHTVIMCSRLASLDAFAAVGAMMTVSSIALLPVAFVNDAILVPWQALEAGGFLIVTLGLSTAAALVLAMVLVRTSGPVFAGQMAYSQAMGGLLWSYMILDERLTPLAWGAFALLLAGVWIVAPSRRSHPTADRRMPA